MAIVHTTRSPASTCGVRSRGFSRRRKNAVEQEAVVQPDRRRQQQRADDAQPRQLDGSEAPGALAALRFDGGSIDCDVGTH
jgi:hypothetical protein